jgi:hypothetical protein
MPLPVLVDTVLLKAYLFTDVQLVRCAMARSQCRPPA